MGEEETKTEASEATENGTTSLSEKPAEAVAEGKEVKGDDGVKEIEEDKKAHEQVETEKMDEDSEVKEDKVMKEEDTKEEKENEADKEKEESKTEAMEEENGSNEKEVDDEKEDKEDEKEKSDEAEDEVQQEKATKRKGPAKRAKGKSGGEKVSEKKPKIMEEKKEPEPRTPAVDRPVRERKSVERLVASIEKDSSRKLHIEKGRGTPLKDIPNVAFKLSRRKTDDTFRLLHSIIFGRRGKAFQLKSNISRFSGFVWRGNEEKQRIKVKEKFDKCNKEKLLEFCDVLDIPTSKTTRRKEDIVMSLIDFLVAPHATTTVLLAEKESNKSNKRKRVSKGSSPSGSNPSKRAKSQKKIEIASKTGKKSTPDTDDESGGEENEEEEEKEEEKENGVLEKSDDEMPEQSESEDKDESEDNEEEVVKRKRTSKALSVKKESGAKSRTKKITVSTKSSPPQERTPKKASAKRSKAEEDSDASLKVFSRKRKNEKATKEKTTTATKTTPKEKPGQGKKAAKGKKNAKEEKLKLTDEKLRVAICEILKEVDFNTATFTDILKLLAQRFDSDLTSRKSSIKLMIQEELTKLADEADDEDGEGDVEKDETQAVVQEVV